jgi:hypothetical protein
MFFLTPVFGARNPDARKLGELRLGELKPGEFMFRCGTKPRSRVISSSQRGSWLYL